ncbi:hypothetical protein D9M71_213420 [compost metagenome]
MGGGDGFLAQALHIERQFLLPLCGDHARVEDTCLEHGAHAAQRQLTAQLRVPGADGPAAVIEHPDQAVGQVAGFGGFHVYGRLAHRAGIRQVQVGEIGLAARSPGGLRDVKAQGRVIGHVASGGNGSGNERVRIREEHARREADWGDVAVLAGEGRNGNARGCGWGGFRA